MLILKVSESFVARLLCDPAISLFAKVPRQIFDNAENLTSTPTS